MEKSISFDIIIDFKVKNREEVYKEIYENQFTYSFRLFFGWRIRC